MNHRWLLLLLLSFTAGNAQSFQSSIEIIEQFDDIKLVAFIKEADLKDYPLWRPSTDAPPLSIRHAIQAIQDLRQTEGEKLSNEAINEIEIRQIPNHESYWHYLVKINNVNAKSKFEVYIVLMNGKVIPAQIEIESYK